MKAVNKDYWREIKNTKSRFISIMILVALAVAFLSGLRATSPDMKRTGSNYANSLGLADIEILSTLGFTEEDLAAIAEREEVEASEGLFVIDAFAISSTTDLVSKVYSIPETGISNVLLKSGRLPEKDDECVLEELGPGMLNVNIGDKIVLKTEGSFEDALKYEEYTVVGTVRSPIYIAVERGSSSIGTGSVKMYLYLPKTSFDMEYYTQVSIKAKGADSYIAFTKEYDDYVDSLIKSLEPFTNKRANDRYEALIDEANEEFDKAQKELDDARLSAQRELDNAKNQLDAAANKISTARQQIDDGWIQYNQSKENFDNLYNIYTRASERFNEYDSRYGKFFERLPFYSEIKAAVDNASVRLEEGRIELENARYELNKAERDYEDGLNEYNYNFSKYENAKVDTKKKLEDAQKELDDARARLREIVHCEWYLFGRSYNPGYSGLGQDADRMGNLSNVFPVIFFLVAALVCLTTMTRMVEEQRIQIGSMKALGYGPLAISWKYVGYGLVPSVAGSVIGLAIGYTVFPTMIFTAYQIMYQVPNIELHAYLDTSLLCVVTAIACTTLSSLWACLATLKETPANLMRPKTPAAGKRVFLEYIKPLWKRLSFIQKVTARNLFRYQKRFWMTVIGIAGCCALMIAGFGIRSSLTYTMHRQYDQLFHYNAMVSLSSNISKEASEALESFFEEDERITGKMQAKMLSVTARSDDGDQTAYLYAVDSKDIADYVDIYSYAKGSTINLGDDGIYIDQKLSELLNVKVGDKILLDSDIKAKAKVAGIFEHYTGHFIYLTPKYYEKLFDEDCEPNGYFLKFESDDAEFCDGIFEDFMQLDGILGTSRLSDIQDTYLHSMERIDFVVVIIILCSGMLALIVLYNLSNINISERQRELATIKVLGFRDGEVSAYVYRENVVLTFFGIILGLLLGHGLHVWLIRSVEIDLMMFGRETDKMAYVFSAILTVVFAYIANLMAHYKMKKIDMVESLKSAE